MAGQWDIEAFPGGNYVLKIDGLFAAEIDEIKNLLFAVAPESIGHPIWKIEPQPDFGKNTYT